MGSKVHIRLKPLAKEGITTPPSAFGTEKKVKGPDTFGEFKPYLPKLSGTRARALKISGTTTLLCASCSKENTLQPNDHGYHYCAHCGNALNIGNVESNLTLSPHVALGFLQFEGLLKETPETTAKSLATLRKIVSEAAHSFGGFAKIMGDKALLAFGLKAGSSPELEAQRLLAALQQISSATSLAIYGGLHVGDVYSGILGIADEKWFDLSGSANNYAARVLGANQHHTPLLVSTAFQKVMPLHWLNLGVPDFFKLKGFDGPQTLIPGTLAGDRMGNTDFLRTKDLTTSHCEHTHESAFCPYCGNAHSQNQQRENESPQSRNIFILSIDIAGYSTTATSLDIKDVARWIMEFYSHVEPIVVRHHGVIIGRNADEVLVRFGAPSQGNTALHAFSAAHELKLALKSQQKKPLIKPIPFRIGIAQAVAYVEGKTTVGDVIKRAQEVQSRAPLNGITIETNLAAQARTFFATAAAAGDPDVVLLTQQKTDTIRLAQQKAAALPLIGRIGQLRLVKEHFDRVKNGESQTLILRGLDGSGRQSVILQLLAENQNQVIDLNGDVNSWLLDPLKAAFRNLFSRMQVLGSDWNKLLSFVRLVTPIAPGEIPAGFEDSDHYMATLLGRYMGFQLGNRTSEGLKNLRANPGLLEKKTQSVVVHFLRKLSLINPVVLVLNHLDQAEAGARKFIETVLEQLKEDKLLVLATIAPDTDTEAWAISHKWEIEFPHFDLANTSKLVGYVIADQTLDAANGGELPDVDPSVAVHVLHETAGQPLHIIELIRSYLAKGWLCHDGTKKMWVLKKPMDGVSETLDDLMLARLDVLLKKNPSSYRLLNLASVAMTDRDWVSRAYLEAAYNGEGQNDAGRKTFENDLRNLIRGGYLTTRNAWGHTDDELLFSPLALGIKAYETMIQDERVPIHQRIHDFITQNMPVGQDYLEAQVLAASHAHKGQLFNEAIRHYDAAINYSRDLGLNAEPLLLIRRATPILDHLPTEKKNSILFEWLTIAFDIHIKRSDKAKAFETLQAMSVLSDKIDDPKLKLKLLDDQVFFIQYYMTDDPDWFDKTENKANTYLPHVDDQAKAHWYNRMGYTYVYLMKLGNAHQAFLAAAKFAETSHSDQEKAKARHGMAIYFGHMGNHADSIEYGREALAIFEKLGDKRKMAEMHTSLASLLFDIKDYEACIVEATHSIKIAHAIEFVVPLIYSHLNWCLALAAKNDFKGAVEKADQALLYAHQANQTMAIVASLTYKSVFMVLDNSEQSRTLAMQALNMADQITPTYKASAHFALALSAAHGKDFETAHQEIINALQIRDTLEQHKLESFNIELDELTTILVKRGFQIPTDLYIYKEPESKLITPLISQRESQNSFVSDEQIEASNEAENPAPELLPSVQNPLILEASQTGLGTSVLPLPTPVFPLPGK